MHFKLFNQTGQKKICVAVAFGSNLEFKKKN
jgi:hypothetical protein